MMKNPNLITINAIKSVVAKATPEAFTELTIKVDTDSPLETGGVYSFCVSDGEMIEYLAITSDTLINLVLHRQIDIDINNHLMYLESTFTECSRKKN